MFVQTVGSESPELVVLPYKWDLQMSGIVENAEKVAGMWRHMVRGKSGV